MAKIKILIVEDEAITANDIRELLEEIGYEVTATVGSGEEALKSFQETPPDLVLMDIQLDGKLDGIQTVAQINKFGKVPVIYLTAWGDQETRSRAKETAYAHYSLKPLNPAQLTIDIEEVIEKFSNENYKEINAHKGKLNNIYVFKDHLFIKKGQAYEKVHKNDIEYIEGDGNLSIFYITNGTKKKYPPIYTGLSQLEVRLSHFKKLVRSHRKYIINMAHIKSFSRKEVTLSTCTLPISKTYYQDFIDKLNQF